MCMNKLTVSQKEFGQYLFRKLYTKLDKSLAHNAYLMYINRQKQRADKWHKKHPDAATETA